MRDYFCRNKSDSRTLNCLAIIQNDLGYILFFFFRFSSIYAATRSRFQLLKLQPRFPSVERGQPVYIYYLKYEIVLCPFLVVSFFFCCSLLKYICVALCVCVCVWESACKVIHAHTHFCVGVNWYRDKRTDHEVLQYIKWVRRFGLVGFISVVSKYKR